MIECFSLVNSTGFDKSFLDAPHPDATVTNVNRLSLLGVELIGLVLIGLISPRSGMPI